MTLDRDAYAHFLALPTRWDDNDVYGHLNNVVYYALFDTAVNMHLIERGGLDIHAAPVIGVVVETSCRYYHELSFPDVVDAGLRVDKLGRTSVVYGIGLFRRGEARAAATGRFVHVWIDRVTRRPTPIPDGVRAALEPLVRAVVEPAGAES